MGGLSGFGFCERLNGRIEVHVRGVKGYTGGLRSVGTSSALQQVYRVISLCF